MTAARGTVAAGHQATAEAAANVLAEGGNAFDAAVAAFFAACVAEPVLNSLGGGGFALVRPAGDAARVYDFFVQTPRRQRPADDCDFFPILADFGTAQQEFHIGYASAATPGAVRGIFALHRDLGRVPLRELVAPACDYARRGLRVNALQAYIFSIVAAIYLADAGARRVFESRITPGRTLAEGEILQLPELADLMESLALEGEDLFYRGEVAQAVIRASEQQGGHLQAEDLAGYQVVARQPLTLKYGDARLLTNPPPSSGGILIAFALALLEPQRLAGSGFGSARHLITLAQAMAATNKARIDAHMDAGELPDPAQMLDPGLLARYRRGVTGRPLAQRGTTHISVLDVRGNAVAMTLSNGEGCGYLLPGCGFMLNNMLGEEDLNPAGFHRWRTDTRMTSMMAPSVLLQPQRQVVLGSGGSNRIRSALLQVLINLLEFGMDVDAAVHAPRLHHEADLLSVEAGFPQPALDALAQAFAEIRHWPEANLFFGGAHTVAATAQGFEGAGDPRRGGVCLQV